MSPTPAPLFANEVRWRFTPAEREAFRLGDERTTVEWAEATIKLPPGVTELHGPWRSAVTPYAREPMNLWDDDHVRRSVKCWAPQTAKTMTSYLPVLRRLARGQGPALLVMSAEAGARKMFRDYVTPIALHSPGLAALLSTNTREDLTSSTIRFLGDRGRFDSAWATSLPRLKSFSYRIALGDEVEDWPSDVDGGGDPEALLDVRTRFYPHTSRIELVSSPGGERGVWAKLAECQEVRVYLARCPHCGAEQRLVWPVKGSPWYPRWEFDPTHDPSRIEGEHGARYLCAAAGCGARWSDAERDRAVATGRWQAVGKEYLAPARWDDPFPEPPAVRSLRPVSVGYHLAAWTSRLVSLSKVVAEFLRAEKTPDPVERRQKLKAWTNNYPAHPWLDERPPEVAADKVLGLRDDRPEGQVPLWGLAVFVTADVQEGGIYWEARAWGAGKKSAGLQHGYLPRVGAVAGPAEPGWEHVAPDFRLLAQVLRREWCTADGELLPTRFALVDSGYRTDEVYEACRLTGAVPSKGADHKKVPLTYHKIDTIPGTGKALPGGLQLVSYDANHWKDELARRLASGPGGLWALHADTGDDYAAHYAAEARDETTKEWVLRGRRANHWWDCGVLQVVAAQIQEQLLLKLERLCAPPRAPAPVRPPAEPVPGNPLSGRNLNPHAKR